MKVIFYPVKTTAMKLSTIIKTATEHFKKEEPLLFLVSDDISWEFLDQLLWSTPPESFLPHPSRWIQIRQSYDPAFSTLFNLSPHPFFHDNLKTLYELEDHTSAEKLKASETRYQSYRAKDLQIIVSNSDGSGI